MLRVYYAELPGNFRADEREYPLSSYRKERLLKTKLPHVRRQMLAAEHLLNQAVLELCPDAALPLEIRTGEREKPYFASLPFFFSLSHSDPFAACAIADHEIGVDIQTRSEYREPIARRCFSESERKFIENSPDRDVAFTELWCLKESYLKATGEGIVRPMSDFSLKLDGGLCLVDTDSVRFWRFGGERFQLAVCSLDGNSPCPDSIVKAELRP